MAINLDAYQLANDLLVRKARVSIIHQETGLSQSFLRKHYKQMHGRSSSRGSTKTIPEFILRTVFLYKQATMFAVLYRACSADFDDIKNIIMAYDRYQELMKQFNLKPRIDFSSAIMVAKWFKSKVLILDFCPVCKGAMLIIDGYPHKIKCGVCKAYI
jgi:hypothetical protein